MGCMLMVQGYGKQGEYGLLLVDSRTQRVQRLLLGTCERDATPHRCPLAG